MSNPNIARRVRISPFRKGMGPVYSLTIDDGHADTAEGRHPVGVRISKCENGKSTVVYNEVMEVPAHQCTDSDDTVVAAFDFYCTDAAASDPHAEALGAAVYDRFESGRNMEGR